MAKSIVNAKKRIAVFWHFTQKVKTYMFDQYEQIAKNARSLALSFKIDKPLAWTCNLNVIFWLSITVFNLFIFKLQKIHWHEQLFFFSRNLHKECHSIHHMKNFDLKTNLSPGWVESL